MLLGTAGVGKTSFKRSLMKLPWKQKTNSTILTDVDTVQPVDNHADLPEARPVKHEWALGEQWKSVNEDDEVEELAYLLAAVYDNPTAAKELLNAIDGISLYDVNSLPVSALTEDEVDAKYYEEVNKILSKAIEKANSISSSALLQERKMEVFLHIWDCGGQPVFLEILPAFLTARTMFLLLFDASKSFDEKWQSIRTVEGQQFCDGNEDMTTQELLLNWMGNIHSRLVTRDERGGYREYPSIYCIGTHGDQVDDKRKREILSAVKSQYLSKAFADLVKDTLIVDNTTAGKGDEEDPNFERVRAAISDFTFNDLAVRVPLSWILFRKVIQIFSKKVITLREAHAIGVACEIPHAHIVKVLLFYHDLGALLYYPGIPGLRDKVIIDPKWFVKAIGMIFTLEGREEYRKDSQAWKLLRDKGILVQPLYVSAWKKCGFLQPDELMNLLVHFNLAAEVKTDKYYDENAKQFFVPAALKSFIGNSSDVKPGFLHRPTFLHITFGTNFVPPGFFTRFATSMAKSEDFKLFFEDGIFRNKIFFKFGVDYIILSDLAFAIQVDILRYARDAVKSFDKVCQDLFVALKKFEKEVDEILDANITGSIKISKEFQYVCTCAPKLHYLIVSADQTTDVSVHCEKNREYRRLVPAEAFWFKKVESKEEIVSQRIEQQEFLEISKQIGDKITVLATSLSMLDQLKAIQQDPFRRNDSAIHLLYDWERAGGGRKILVEALHNIGLSQLANQVNRADYSQKPKLPQSDITNINNNSSDHDKKSQDDFAKVLKEVVRKELEEQMKQKTQHLKSDTQLEESASSSNPNNLSISVGNDGDEFTSKAAVDESVSPPTIQRLEIEDGDLVRCSDHFRERDINKLVGALDDPELKLCDISKRHNETPKVKAYLILKKWLEAHPSTSKEFLRQKLESLNFQKAAQSLQEIEEQKHFFSDCCLM